MKTIGAILGLVILAGAEYFCYITLRQHGFSTPASIGATLALCVTLFLLVGFMFLSRSAPYARVSDEPDLNTVLRQRHAQTLVSKRVAPPPVAEEDGYIQPSTAIAPAMSGMSHLQSEAFRDELVKALEEKRSQFQKVLADSAVELSRFDYSVLKTLSRNNPASVEGVLIARRIHNALEHRYKEIERFLASQPAVDPEKGKQLLLGDLEVPEENQLTAVFKSPAVPPIKVSEIEFQLRVLLKRISRRRSIFRSTDMMDAQMAAEAVAKEREAQEAAKAGKSGKSGEHAVPMVAPMIEEAAAEEQLADEQMPEEPQPEEETLPEDDQSADDTESV